jgi:hypothetical protein
MAAGQQRPQMIQNNHRRPSVTLRVFLWLLQSAGALITASAVVIVFVAVPYAFLERRHMLPHWDIFWLFFIFVPFVAAWEHAGPYLLVTVTACEIALSLLRPGSKKARIVAVGCTAVCLAAYLWIFTAKRFNFH